MKNFMLIGTPMTCWVPSEFKEGKAKFALDYCYIQNTYVVPTEDTDVSFDRDRASCYLQFYRHNFSTLA